MDLYFFSLINQFAFKWFCLDALGIFFADYLGYILIFCLLLFLVVRFKKYWKMVVAAFISAAISRFVIVNLIRWLWQRPRPFVENNVNLLLTHNAAGFPSGHAAFYFAIATVVYFYNKKAGLLFFGASLLICFSRVFVGIHWPADILAGILVGIFSGWLTNKFFKKFIK